MSTTPIVIDCDPGHDDAIAILLALASPEVELRGITTVAGNQTLEKTTRNALKVLELAGRADIPVAAGAKAPLRAISSYFPMAIDQTLVERALQGRVTALAQTFAGWAPRELGL